MKVLFLLALVTICFEVALAYSASEDARIIAEYKQQLQQEKDRPKDHAKIARNLVHQANWAAVGSLSINTKIQGFPMVNIISIDDNAPNSKSTGKIHFFLTDMDFTGPDWRHNNKVTFLFTDEQNLKCKNKGLDPMEPTCPRVIISGKVIEMDKTKPEYKDAKNAFIQRHPAAKKWIIAHHFYLCELEIENIFVLDFYGGPHNVSAEDFYRAEPDTDSEEV